MTQRCSRKSTNKTCNSRANSSSDDMRSGTDVSTFFELSSSSIEINRKLSDINPRSESSDTIVLPSPPNIYIHKQTNKFITAFIYSHTHKYAHGMSKYCGYFMECLKLNGAQFWNYTN